LRRSTRGEPKGGVYQQTPIRVVPGNKVDLLFMVDDSSSMGAMQDELKSKFGEFLKIFDNLAQTGFYTDLQIGVVTSDYGAGSKGDEPSQNARCDPYGGGKHGFLQSGDGRCGPPIGHPYIEYVYGAGGSVHNNLPPGKSLADTFTCMASVGAEGCGFEHQLEAVYAALKNKKENAGFLRDDALLAVVFVTNEDDGSAPPDSVFYNWDAGGAWDDQYGNRDTFRQTRFGIQCGSPLMLLGPDASTAPLSGCVSIPNSPQTSDYEFDVQRYINLFKLPTQQGGVKDSPDDILLFAIDGPETPFETDWVKKPIEPPQPRYEPCPPPLDTNRANCRLRLQHSCMNNNKNEFFADPAIRLNTVLRSFSADSQIKSICGEDLNQNPDFTSALQALADAIVKRLPGCLIAKLTDRDNPDCVVFDTAKLADGSENTVVIAKCGSSQDSGTGPCWRIKPNDLCKNTPEGLAAAIDRRGLSTPTGTVTHFECSTEP
jgi:hypothetical protein